MNFRGIDGDGAGDGGEPKTAVGEAAGGGLGAKGALGGGQSIALVVTAAGDKWRGGGGGVVEVAFAQAHQAGVGAKPQKAFPVLDDVINTISHQAVGGGVMGPFSVAQANQTIALRADPKGVVRVGAERGDGIAGETIGLTEDSEPAVAHPVQAAEFGADPEIAGAVFGDGVNDVGGEAVGGGEELPLVVLQAGEAGGGPDP